MTFKKNLYLLILLINKQNNIFINKSRLERISFIYMLYKLYSIYYNINITNIKSLVLYYCKDIPLIKNHIDKEKNNFNLKIKEDLNKSIRDNSLIIYDKLPMNSLKENDIVDIIKKNKSTNWKNETKISGTIYTNDNKLDQLMINIFPIYYRSNPLHPDIYPGIRKMEAEIIQMCSHLFKSKDNCSGSFTSGGTESIILACKTYRDTSSINNPSILVCSNGHAAYWKAGHYLGINIIEVPFNKDGKLTLNVVKKYIRFDTIAVITSAPSFHFGIIDDIEDISEYCFKKNIFVHIDMCLGGFILPFIEKYNKISFLSKGITSISLDTHKYGCGPKGGSVILYKCKSLYKQQIFVKDDWTGGIYGTANISGSRCGNVISLTWATMMYYGYKGYKKNANRIIELTLYLKGEINKIPELFCFGDPEICIVAIGSKQLNIVLLSDKLKDKGWNLNVLQNPLSFHLCITNCHTLELIKEFINDMKTNIEFVKGNNIESSSLYGSTQKIDNTEIISDVVKEYFYILNDIN